MISTNSCPLSQVKADVGSTNAIGVRMRPAPLRVPHLRISPFCARPGSPWPAQRCGAVLPHPRMKSAHPSSIPSLLQGWAARPQARVFFIGQSLPKVFQIQTSRASPACHQCRAFLGIDVAIRNRYPHSNCLGAHTPCLADTRPQRSARVQA
jgi:hypothetical protein